MDIARKIKEMEHDLEIRCTDGACPAVTELLGRNITLQHNNTRLSHDKAIMAAHIEKLEANGNPRG